MSRLRLLKPYYRSRLLFVKESTFSSFSSTSDDSLVQKAITYLRRHPQQLDSLSSQFTPGAASSLLIKSQFDQTLTLNFLKWARNYQFFDFQCKCIALHVLTRFKLYKTAQTIAEDLVFSVTDKTGSSIFNCLKSSYFLFNSSSAVFDLLVKSYSHLKMVNKALNTISLAKEYGFMLGVLSYNSVLDAMFRSRLSINDVNAFYLEMIGSGISPNVFTYNIMIRGFLEAGEFEKGMDFFYEMERNGCLPNVVTFNTLIDVYGKAGRINEAYRLLKSMPKNGLQPNLISYNVVINGLCRKRMMKESIEIFEEMTRNYVVPDETTYNTLINGYCKDGNFHHALYLHEEMVKHGLFPNVITYTSLINSMCKANNLNRAMEFFNQMQIKGLRPNERTYTTLIDGFSAQGFLTDAYRVLNEMIKSGFSPSIVALNALINGHCILGRIEEAQGIIRDMINKGMTPDLVSYSTIISGLCKNHDLEKAFQMKDEMVRNGISPDCITYSSLIRGLCEEQRLTEACDLFREMFISGLLPDEITYTTLINAYCVEGDLNNAINLYNEMINKGFLPDVVTCSVLISGLSKQDRTREAKKLLFKLIHDDNVPSNVTYKTLIDICSNVEFKSAEALVKGFCMKGLMNEADCVLELMIERKCKPNEAIYNTVTHGHCKVGNSRKALNLYGELVDLGFVPHAGTVVALIKVLYKEGMSEELSHVVRNTLRSCRISEGEISKTLVEINHKEGNLDAVSVMLAEMAKNGLLPNGGGGPACATGISTRQFRSHGRQI